MGFEPNKLYFYHVIANILLKVIKKVRWYEQVIMGDSNSNHSTFLSNISHRTTTFN